MKLSSSQANAVISD